MIPHTKKDCLHITTPVMNHPSHVLSKRPGRFPGIARNAGNQGNNRKIHKSDQTLNQTKRDINKLCLGKISLQKIVRMKLSVDSTCLPLCGKFHPRMKILKS